MKAKLTEVASKLMKGRRSFLKGAALSGAAVVAAPAVVKAQGPINFRFQSTWPSKDIFHEFALDYAKKDPEGFRIFVNKTAGVLLTAKVAGDPPAGGGGEMDETAIQVCKMFGNKPEDVKKFMPAA